MYKFNIIQPCTSGSGVPVTLQTTIKPTLSSRDSPPHAARAQQPGLLVQEVGVTAGSSEGWAVGLKWRPASASLRRVLLCSVLRAFCGDKLSACLRLCLALALLPYLPVSSAPARLRLRLRLRTCACARACATSSARALLCLFLRVHLRPRVESASPSACVHVYVCECV